jgi:hypothetical protein
MNRGKQERKALKSSALQSLRLGVISSLFEIGSKKIDSKRGMPPLASGFQFPEIV